MVNFTFLYYTHYSKDTAMKICYIFLSDEKKYCIVTQEPKGDPWGMYAAHTLIFMYCLCTPCSIVPVALQLFLSDRSSSLVFGSPDWSLQRRAAARHQARHGAAQVILW